VVRTEEYPALRREPPFHEHFELGEERRERAVYRLEPADPLQIDDHRFVLDTDAFQITSKAFVVIGRDPSNGRPSGAATAWSRIWFNCSCFSSSVAPSRTSANWPVIA
jgi:hypothetical protein